MGNSLSSCLEGEDAWDKYERVEDSADEKMKKIIEDDYFEPIMVHTLEKDGKNILTLAVEKNCLGSLKLLLEKFVDPKYNKNHQTNHTLRRKFVSEALSVAVGSSSKFEFCKALLEAESAISEKHRIKIGGELGSHLLSKADSEEIINALIKHHANPCLKIGDKKISELNPRFADHLRLQESLYRDLNTKNLARIAEEEYPNSNPPSNKEEIPNPNVKVKKLDLITTIECGPRAPSIG